LAQGISAQSNPFAPLGAATVSSSISHHDDGYASAEYAGNLRVEKSASCLRTVDGVTTP
jgi:hypothetical protein